MTGKLTLLFLIVTTWLPLSEQQQKVDISPSILEILESSVSPSVRVNVMLSMTKARSLSVVTAHIPSAATASRSDRATTIVEALKAESAQVQNDLLAFIEKTTSTLGPTAQSAIRVDQLWITNQVIVRNVNLELLRALSTHPDISRIEEETIVHLIAPVEVQEDDHQNLEDDEIQWGLKQIRAPEIWAQGNRGANVVVGAIDTGVRSTHEALKSNFRRDHGWFDVVSFSQEPTDPNGHGTHSLGSIVGQTRGVGVAPEAQWISCRALDERGFGTSFSMLYCMQWMACPTNPLGRDPDCSKAPALVSNSWGGTSNDFSRPAIEVWHLLGIVPVFAIGNEGVCSSAGSPGNYRNVIGVGSIDVQNLASDFTSGGPAKFGEDEIIKPDIAAPGSDILSAGGSTDVHYQLMSGTSMACPHVSGLIALLLSDDSELTFGEIKRKLERGAVPTSGSTGRNCGNIEETLYPNNVVGHGVIDAINSFSDTSTTPTPEPDPTSEQTTNPTSGPTNPTSEPTNPTSGPTNPTSGPTNPTSGPTNPTSGPTNPTSGPTNPTSEPTTDQSPKPTEVSSTPSYSSTSPTSTSRDTTERDEISGSAIWRGDLKYTALIVICVIIFV